MGKVPVKKKAKAGAKSTAVVTSWLRAKGKGLAGLTSIRVAELAAKELGFRTSANQLCRLMRKHGISFKSSPDDPKPQNYSKVDLLKARMDLLEGRIRDLEKRYQ